MESGRQTGPLPREDLSGGEESAAGERATFVGQVGHQRTVLRGYVILGRRVRTEFGRDSSLPVCDLNDVLEHEHVATHLLGAADLELPFEFEAAEVERVSATP